MNTDWATPAYFEAWAKRTPHGGSMVYFTGELSAEIEGRRPFRRPARSVVEIAEMERLRKVVQAHAWREGRRVLLTQRRIGPKRFAYRATIFDPAAARIPAPVPPVPDPDSRPEAPAA